MSASVTSVTVDTAALRKVFHDQRGAIGQDLDKRGRRVLDHARRGVGVDTGLLLSTIRMNRGDNSRGQYLDVIAGVQGLTPYLGYHMEGTRPHIIRPRRTGGWLRFTSGGRVVYAKQVNHPGTRPNRFLEAALRFAV